MRLSSFSLSLVEDMSYMRREARISTMLGAVSMDFRFQKAIHSSFHMKKLVNGDKNIWIVKITEFILDLIQTMKEKPRTDDG